MKSVACNTHFFSSCWELGFEECCGTAGKGAAALLRLQDTVFLDVTALPWAGSLSLHLPSWWVTVSCEPAAVTGSSFLQSEATWNSPRWSRNPHPVSSCVECWLPMIHSCYLCRIGLYQTRAARGVPTLAIFSASLTLRCLLEEKSHIPALPCCVFRQCAFILGGQSDP